MTRIATLLGCALLLACGRETDVVTPRPAVVSAGREFSLRPGQSATVTGAALQITFVSVAEDSRCPVDAVCVWEGNARIALRVEPKDAEPTTVELDTSGDMRTATVGGRSIELVRLEPARRTDEPIRSEDYLATLLVGEG